MTGALAVPKKVFQLPSMPKLKLVGVEGSSGCYPRVIKGP
jgi:hypothetical protein